MKLLALMTDQEFADYMGDLDEAAAAASGSARAALLRRGEQATAEQGRRRAARRAMVVEACRMSARLWPSRQEKPEPLPHPEHWTEFARCAEVGNDFWFPEKGGSTREAKAVCRMCDVRAECLEYALETGQRYGIWGGLSERERQRIPRAGTSAALAA